ncbi:MAG TPA: hypothetical protein VGI70_11645, partial [Polyangiales bacterium]
MGPFSSLFLIATGCGSDSSAHDGSTAGSDSSGHPSGSNAGRAGGGPKAGAGGNAAVGDESDAGAAGQDGGAAGGGATAGNDASTGSAGDAGSVAGSGGSAVGSAGNGSGGDGSTEPTTPFVPAADSTYLSATDISTDEIDLSADHLSGEWLGLGTWGVRSTRSIAPQQGVFYFEAYAPLDYFDIGVATA